jgi:hypothetical protein
MPGRIMLHAYSWWKIKFQNNNAGGVKKGVEVWGSSSVLQDLPGMWEALGSNPSTTEVKQKGTEV